MIAHTSGAAMNFVLGQFPNPGSDVAFALFKDDWNDWFTWYTMYSVVAILPNGNKVQLGRTKIARAGMTAASASTVLPDHFISLDDSHFSLGETENYYETLNSLGPQVRDGYLNALRDCAYDLDRLDRFIGEPAMRESVLRDFDQARVRTRLNRLAHGNIVLTSYSFEYAFPTDPKALTVPPTLTFKVTPHKLPATNIHVLIGRNGVGKTRCFDYLARSFLGIPATDPNQSTGMLRNTAQSAALDLDSPSAEPDFAGLVTVSFSAFDNKGPLVAAPSAKKRYAYVGLVEFVSLGSGGPQVVQIKSNERLAQELANSIRSCQEGVRKERWRRALKTLEADPLFAEANLSTLTDLPPHEIDTQAGYLLRNLSSGHNVVLLSITKMVEFVEEKSLVLLDEPESHLHPPLLAAFVRALSDLLIDRNGVAIVATHSPVVLQEVPSDCVWKLNRAGREVRADRPEIQTFGENVGVLTREVFTLEVTQTGFHKLISEHVPHHTYEEVLQIFNNKLGAEARGLVRALTLVDQTPSTDASED